MLREQLELARINAWANKKIRESLQTSFDELKDVETPYGTFQELVYHIPTAIYFWLKRIGCAQYDLLPKEQVKSVEELFNQWEITDQALITFVEQMEAENKPANHKFKYKTSKGLEFEITLELILLQLNNHGSYHRGQLAYIVRSNNKPGLPATDALVYYREKK